MKTLLIYHSVDNDGWMSAAIVKKWFMEMTDDQGIVTDILPLEKEESDRNILYTYGYNRDEVPVLNVFDQVIMCDISFEKDIMDDLYNRYNNNFVWIDHHISTMEKNNEFINGIRDENYAACELTWKFFYPDVDMPEIVRLLGRYDCFGSVGTSEEKLTFEFEYGSKTFIKSYEDAYKYLHLTYNDKLQLNNIYDANELTKIYIHGTHVYKFLCENSKKIYGNGFDMKLKSIDSDEMYNVKFVNYQNFNPKTFKIDFNSEGYDAAATFYFDGEQYNFSIYSNDVDCSKIAKYYGGGGHKEASGFKMNMEQFNELFKI